MMHPFQSISYSMLAVSVPFAAAYVQGGTWPLLPKGGPPYNLLSCCNIGSQQQMPYAGLPVHTHFAGF